MDPTGPLRGQNESRVLRPHVAQRLLAFLGLDGKVSEELLLLSLSLSFSLSPDVVVVATTTTKAATVVVQLSFSRSSASLLLLGKHTRFSGSKPSHVQEQSPRRHDFLGL